MGKNVMLFFIGFLVAFGVGYLMYQEKSQMATEVPETQIEESVSEPAKATASPTAASAEGETLIQKGCLACHAVSGLGLDGGVTGPDLSQSYVNVADKHGVPLEEFLQKPTSAVMSGVLGSNPLTDEERQALIEELKKASEK